MRHELAVGAVCGAVNEPEAGNSPPDIGGEAAPLIKRCEATAAAQTGWSGLSKGFGMRSFNEVPFPTTPSAPLKEASQHLIDVASTINASPYRARASRPPMSGGELRSQFIPSFIERAFLVLF